jgi:hypothetical protein
MCKGEVNSRTVHTVVPHLPRGCLCPQCSDMAVAVEGLGDDLQAEQA